MPDIIPFLQKYKKYFYKRVIVGHNKSYIANVFLSYYGQMPSKTDHFERLALFFWFPTTEIGPLPIWPEFPLCETTVNDIQKYDTVNIEIDGDRGLNIYI